jgi:hypothetical protein
VGVTAAAVALDLVARPPYDGAGVLRWLGSGRCCLPFGIRSACD